MNNNEDKEQILKETIEYISKSSKLLKKVSELVRDKVKEFPLLDDLVEEYIQVDHLYDRTPKLLKLMDELNIHDIIISNNDTIQKIENLKYELEHLIETTQFRIDDINIYFNRVENEYFNNENNKKNGFYIELNSYNTQIQNNLKRLKSIYDNGSLLIKEMDDIHKKKMKNEKQVMSGYFNTAIALFIILVSLALYYSQPLITKKTTTTPLEN